MSDTCLMRQQRSFVLRSECGMPMRPIRSLHTTLSFSCFHGHVLASRDAPSPSSTPHGAHPAFPSIPLPQISMRWTRFRWKVSMKPTSAAHVSDHSTSHRDGDDGASHTSMSRRTVRKRHEDPLARTCRPCTRAGTGRNHAPAAEVRRFGGSTARFEHLPRRHDGKRQKHRGKRDRRSDGILLLRQVRANKRVEESTVAGTVAKRNARRLTRGNGT